MGSTCFIIGDLGQDIEIYDILNTSDHDILSISTCEQAYLTTFQVMPDFIIMTNIKDETNLSFMRKLKDRHETACLPILAILGQNNQKIKLQAIKAGINDFIYAPLDFEELKLKINNYSIIGQHRRAVLSENAILKREIAIKTIEMKSNILNIQEAYAEVIMKLSRAAEYKDPETGNHINRVAYYCRTLAESLGMDSNYQEQIFFAATMHDIGKIGIPDKILLKNGSLNHEEWAIMQTHPWIGYEILNNPKDATLAMAQDIALCHHEKFDGSGYPNGIKKHDIPLAARIMALADVYDALRSDRPYKAGFSHRVSMDILLRGDGRVQPEHFDPEVLNIFEKKSSFFNDIYEGVVGDAK